MTATGLPVHELEPRQVDLPGLSVGGFHELGPFTTASFPHRHRFIEVIHLTGGAGWHILDDEEFELLPPQLAVVCAGQVHYWRATRRLRGRLMLFHEDLITRAQDSQTLRALGHRGLLALSPSRSAGVANLLDAIAQEVREQQSQHTSVAQAYLHVLVVYAARWAELHDRGGPHAVEPGDLTRADIVRRFYQLVAERVGTGSVADYASRLGVSVSHLGDAVRHATGTAPGGLLRAARVLEAKRLLGATDLTVARVANELGFEDSAYFCRFFRRETGCTPGSYRRQIVQNHHVSVDKSIDPGPGRV